MTRVAAARRCVTWGTAIVLAMPSTSAAQSSPSRLVADERFAREWWRNVPAASDTLRVIVAASLQRAGPATLHVLLETTADTTRPELVRLYALVAIVAYVTPNMHCRAAFDSIPAGQPIQCGAVSHSDDTPSTSIEPVRKDTVRAHIRALSSRGGRLGEFAKHIISFNGNSERVDDRVRLECQSLARTVGVALQMDPVAVIASQEFFSLSRCPDSGPPGLAAAWRVVPATDSTLDRLRFLTPSTRDRRIHHTLLAVASDGSRPRAVRFAALASFAVLLHPRMDGYQREESLRESPRPCITTRLYPRHALQEEGSEPLGARSRWEGVARLRQLADQTRDTQLRDEARFLAACVERLLREFPSPL